MAEALAHYRKQLISGLPTGSDSSASRESFSADLAARIDGVIALLKQRPSASGSEFMNPFGGIEARIAHLEASTAHLEKDVAQMRTDLREIRERLPRIHVRSAQLPTKALFGLSVLIIITAVVAVAAFQQQLENALARVLHLV